MHRYVLSDLEPEKQGRQMDVPSSGEGSGQDTPVDTSENVLTMPSRDE